MSLDSGLYGDGTSGWSGSETSRERAVRETLSPRRRQVYDIVAHSRQIGRTVGEVEYVLGLGHGSASSALTILHRGGHITRLTERRRRQEVYVLPQYVNEREESPYRPNSRGRSPRDLTRDEVLDLIEQVGEDPTKHYFVVKKVLEAL